MDLLWLLLEVKEVDRCELLFKANFLQTLMTYIREVCKRVLINVQTINPMEKGLVCDIVERCELEGHDELH